MITILLGQDSFAKDEYISGTFTHDKSLELHKIRSGEVIPNFSTVLEPTLFGPPPVYIFDHCYKDLNVEKLRATAADTAGHIVIIEDSIDQRKTVNKEILRDKRITVKDFQAPNRSSAVKWIVGHAKSLQITIDASAAEALCNALLQDEHGKLNVHAAHNELLKLHSYANSEKITAGMVEQLVESNVAVDTFKLLNAVGEKNQAQAQILLNNFFEQTSGDEKAKAILLSALLSDQLRSVLIVKDATTRGLPEDAVLSQTGWKSGRLFMVKKLANQFSLQMVKQTLIKLQNLDIELKSSTMPPHVILAMIIAQI